MRGGVGRDCVSRSSGATDSDEGVRASYRLLRGTANASQAALTPCDLASCSAVWIMAVCRSRSRSASGQVAVRVFLDLNDRLGLLQARLEALLLAAQLGVFDRQRVNLRPAPVRG